MNRISLPPLSFSLTRVYWVLSGIALMVALLSLLIVGIGVLIPLLRPSKPPMVVKEDPQVWVSRAVTYCDEPWHRRQIDRASYLRSLGVVVFDTIITGEKQAACVDCSCITGEVVNILVPRSSLSDLQGFVETSPPERSQND